MKNIKTIKNGIILALVLSILFTSTAFGIENLEERSSAYLLGDFDTGRILEGYNIDKPMEIASITKLMTYLVVMEEIDKKNINFDDTVMISEKVSEVKGSSLNLKKGEILTIEQLLDGLLIVSANDAAVALAEYVMGSEENFVHRMNQKAKEIGLDSAKFVNATGLPKGEEQNKMSPVDIFNLSRYILNKYPQILQITNRTILQMPWRDFEEENTNTLIKNMKGVDGLKTGFTDKAGYCLVSTIRVNELDEDSKFRLIGVVMGTESEEERENVTRELLTYAVDNYEKKCILSTEEPVGEASILNGKTGKVDAYPEKNLYYVMKKDENIINDLNIDTSIKAPIKIGTVVGNSKVYIGDKFIEEINLVTKDEVPKINFFFRVLRSFKAVFVFLSKAFTKMFI